MYMDTIVLGATFAAAGLIQAFRDDCLILERRPQAGYEFLNAMKTGTGYDRKLMTCEAQALWNCCREKGAFETETVSLPRCVAPFYSCLQGKQVLLNMELISLEKISDGWEVTAHGVSGYRTFTAGRIIDTRVHDWMLTSKAIHILVNGDKDSGECRVPGIPAERYGEGEDIVLKCPVPVEADYPTARKAAAQMIVQLPKDYKVIHVADMFACEVRGKYPMEQGGIVYMPSCAWENPFLAFDAGAMYGKEHDGYGAF